MRGSVTRLWSVRATKWLPVWSPSAGRIHCRNTAASERGSTVTPDLLETMTRVEAGHSSRRSRPTSTGEVVSTTCSAGEPGLEPITSESTSGASELPPMPSNTTSVTVERIDAASCASAGA